ncbi:hypothetical protein AB0J35_56885 [Nonomuraea angiospora]|uniref:ATP-binding protein n=1 Tax=Nonomuraea angiospora TaxID=46172 RepID=UPI00343FC485
MDPVFQRSGNLHQETASFVGRTRLLANLKRHLGKSRLVTVTGIGGVGKSRTVLRLAHQIRAHYPDGVWLADLARLQDAGMVKHAIASALGIADQSSRAESESLSEWVGERDMLLIIDTCEHLVQGCAELVHELLEAAPNLKVLATSRQSLNLPYEHVVPVPPLQVPGDDPAERLFANESVQLFAARAGASCTDFVLDEDNIAPVAELCRRLDGIPLAIELAAVRLRALSVEQILGLLVDRFSLLAGGHQTVLPRHQTLRAAIGWSHELCEPAERLLWARLSVFAGDFELEAARFVCSDGRLPSEDITDLVAGLVEKSILLFRSNHAGVRYKLIDTLAEYGEEWLDKLGQREQMQQRHLEYYLSLAQRSEDAWSGPRQIYWFVRMRQEHDNVRVALDHALKSPGKSVLALTLLSSLWFMWVCCGFAREGRLYLERALQANPTVSKERCKALWVLSYVRSAQGDNAGALKAAEQCSTEAVRVGDSRAVILASKMQGTAALLQGDVQKASALLGVAIEFNTDNKELNPGLLPAIVELSLVLSSQGEFYEAESLLLDCLQVCRERGELWLSSHAQWALAGTRLASGRVEDALQNAREALRIKRHFRDTLGMLMALETAARIFVLSDQLTLAAKLLGALQQNWKMAGLPQLGAPWMTEEHNACMRDCRLSLGDGRYEREFTDGARLDLEAASALALDVYDISESIRLESDTDGLVTETDYPFVQIDDTVNLGAQTASRSRSEDNAKKSRADASGQAMDERLDEVDLVPYEEISHDNVAQTATVEALIASLKNMGLAVVLIEQTLFIKLNSTIVDKESAAERSHMGDRYPRCDDPTALLRELGQVDLGAESNNARRLISGHRKIIRDRIGEAAMRALEALADAGDYEVMVSRSIWEDDHLNLHEIFVEWIYDHFNRMPLGDVDFQDFSDEHGLDVEVTFTLLRQCKERGFVDDCHDAMGKPIASLTDSGHDWVKQRKERRGDRFARIAAARNGLLRWLWERKQEGVYTAVVDDVLKSPESVFEGERFTLPEIDRAAASLREKGLILDVIGSERIGPVRAQTTDSGDRCVEQYGGNVSEYEQRQLGSHATYNIQGDNKGIIASHSQNIRMDASFIEAGKVDEIIKFVQQYRQAVPVLNLAAGPGAELAQLTDELEQEANSHTPDVSRLRNRLKRVGEILNSQVVGGALGNMLATGALELMALLA